MPRIAEESVREVLDVADLVELVRSRTALTKRGGRWVGRCPFHEERTPSFGLIPPENRYYYCHGCGAKGTAIDWMMSKEGAGTYPEALEGLAERFGVTLRYEQSTPEEDARRRSDARHTRAFGGGRFTSWVTTASATAAVPSARRRRSVRTWLRRRCFRG